MKESEIQYHFLYQICFFQLSDIGKNYTIYEYIYVLEHYISTWKDVEITLDKHLFPHHINKSGVPKEKK